MRRASLLPLRVRHVWAFVLIASVGAGSLPAGRGRYVATLVVCVLGIAGFFLAMRSAGSRRAPLHRPESRSGSTVVRQQERSAPAQPRPLAPTPSSGASAAAVDVAVASQSRLAGPVDTASVGELMGLVGDQVAGGDGRGVQLWATPVDDDGLDIEFIDATGAHACLRVAAQGFVADDPQ